MSVKNNEFYICLFSNNSLNFYPKNTLSAFTNMLARPINIEDGWRVGVTELSLPERRVAGVNRQLSDKDVARSIVKRSYVPPFINVKLDEKTHLQWWNNGLKALCYLNRHINFSVFLATFFTAVVPSWDNVLINDVKRKIVERLEKDYTQKTIPEVNKKRTSADSYTMHIYQGDDISENVVLERKDYDTIQSFFDDIIGQIPRNKRKHGYNTR